MLDTTMELFRTLGESSGGWMALFDMSALALPLPLVLAFAMIIAALVNISALPNPYYSVLLGFGFGPLIVVVLTELWRFTPSAEPAVFHEPWWITAMVPAVLGPKIFDWNREGSPTALILFIVGLVVIFGSLAMVATRYAI